MTREKTVFKTRPEEDALVGILQTMPVGVFLFEDNRVIYANPVCADLFGVQIGDLEKMGVEDLRSLVPAEDLLLVRSGLDTLAAGETPSPLTHRIRRRNGGLGWVDAHLSSIQLGDRSLTRVLFYDVTDKVETELSLRRSETLLRSIADSAQDSIFCKDVERRYTFVNDAMARLLGAPADTLLGKTPLEVFGEDEGRTVNDVDNRCLAGEEVSAFRSMLIGDEEYTFHTIQVPQRDASGQIIGITGIVRDVTEATRAQQEKEALEQQLLQAQKLEAIGRLAGGVAHDFNNLLTEISGNASLALMGLGADDPTRDSFDAINDAARRAASLTRQLLAFSRKQVFQPTLVSLNELVGNMEAMLRRLLGADVFLKTRLFARDAYVMGDPGQLEQVLLNLVINARDAMPDGGTISIVTQSACNDLPPCKACPERHEGTFIRLTVADTGIGMDAETVGHIFEPFFTTKSKDKGTGLGLSTTYGIVQQHDGSIHVESEPNAGSSFHICLPKSAGASDIAPPRKVDEVMSGDERVLYVEDEPAVKEVTTAILERLGYDVHATASPAEALELLPRISPPPVLLLTDVILPGMNGRELALKVKQQLPDIRILYTSGYSENVLATQTDGEFIHFIGKPASPQALSLKIRQVLDNTDE